MCVRVSVAINSKAKHAICGKQLKILTHTYRLKYMHNVLYFRLCAYNQRAASVAAQKYAKRNHIKQFASAANAKRLKCIDSLSIAHFATTETSCFCMHTLCILISIYVCIYICVYVAYVWCGLLSSIYCLICIETLIEEFLVKMLTARVNLKDRLRNVKSADRQGNPALPISLLLLLAIQVFEGVLMFSGRR